MDTTAAAATAAPANVLPIADVRDNLKTIIDDVITAGHEFTITRHGRAVAVILSIDEYESMVETLNILSDDDAMDAIAEAESEFSGEGN